jgi:serine/threonine-protein kinase RsbW
MIEPRTGASEILLTIPSKAEYLGFCRLVLAGLARARTLDEESLADLKLAVTEACSNVIRHAYPDELEGEIEIHYLLEPEAVTIEVVDNGTGFEASAEVPVVEEAEPSPDALSDHGMGIAIIATLMDELELTPGPAGRGSRFRFTKYL